MYASLNLSEKGLGIHENKAKIRLAQGDYERSHEINRHQLLFQIEYADYRYDHIMVEVTAGQLVELHEIVGHYVEDLAAMQKEGAQA